MPIGVTDGLLVAGAYLLGSVPFGYLIARSRGVDIFNAGSGNIGATNVGRVLGARYGYPVFLLDFFKGAAAAGVTSWWRGGPDAVAVAAGLASILGHMFSVFLRFRGGKGVATGAGVCAFLLPGPAALSVIAFLSVFVSSRVMSFAAVSAAVVLAVARLSLVPDVTSAATLFAVFAAALVVLRHRTNLARLATGTEPVIERLDAARRFTPGAHALAVGLWCGAGWFFSLVAAPQVFANLNAVVDASPEWLPAGDGPPAEVASRLAGATVGPMFPVYFALQAVCGLVATGTALGWAIADRGRWSRARAVLLPVALLLVALGWPVAQRVNDLRDKRYDWHPAARYSFRESFARWHGTSLVLNLTALALVTPALALAAYPPRFERPTTTTNWDLNTKVNL